MKHTILCINSGSSSIKFALYLVQETEELMAEGAEERIGLSGGWLWPKGEVTDDGFHRRG